MIKRINIFSIWFILLISVFLLSEHCIYFSIIDSLHIKHLLVLLTLIFCALIGLKPLKYRDNIKNLFETKQIFSLIILLFIISIFIQASKISFKSFIFKELYYLFVPIALSFFIVNSGKKISIDSIINTFLYVGLISFLLSRYSLGVFTLKNVFASFNLKTLFFDSVSPLGESTLSIYFSILFLYYLFKSDYNKAFLAIIGTILGYKRIAVFYSLFVLLFYSFIKKYKYNKINKIFKILLIALITVLPILAKLIYSNEFSYWFYSTFGIDFNLFTMTRLDIVSAVLNGPFENYGIGSVTYFLELRGIPGQLNLHNDLLRIYLECGIIGLLFFIISLCNICKDNIYSYFIMLFIFLQMLMTPMLGYGTISMWILIYLVLFTINNSISDKVNCESEEIK